MVPRGTRRSIPSTAVHEPNVRVRPRVSMANASFMSRYSVFSERAERAPLTAATVAARNTMQLAIQEAKFVLLNNPPFRTWKSDAAYSWTNQPQVNTPNVIVATEAASSIEGAVNQRRRCFDKSLRRMACLTLIALRMVPAIIRTNVTELRAQRVVRGGQS